MVSFLNIIYLVIFRLEGYWLINVHLVTPFQIKLLPTLLFITIFPDSTVWRLVFRVTRVL